MILYILGIITVLLFRFMTRPKPVVVYSQDAIEMMNIGYKEDMTQQFSTIIDDTRFTWDVENLWVEFESLQDVEWEIPETFKEEWSWGGDHPAEHIERCLDADLSYPILIWDDAIIDGCHRVVKALAKGQKTIKAKIIINIPPPDKETQVLSNESNEGVNWTFRDMVSIIQATLEYDEVTKYKFRHPCDGI